LPNVKNNVIHDLANGVVGYAKNNPGPVEISGNLIYNIRESNAGSHPNAIEIVGGGTTYYIHDNVLHDNLGESLMFGNSGETDYIWNNVIYNVLGNMPEAPQVPGQTGMQFKVWNNTIVPGSGQQCFNWNSGDGGTFNSVTIQNNYCITTATTAANSTWNNIAATLTNNVVQTPAAAAAQGFTSSESYAYSPTSASSSIVGAGTNLSSILSGLLASLTSDTTYACALNATNHVATCPARSVVSRPSIGVWDAGAYQHSTSQVQASVQSPTNLAAAVQ
jgi:hypothetical protein